MCGQSTEILTPNLVFDILTTMFLNFNLRTVPDTLIHYVFSVVNLDHVSLVCDGETAPNITMFSAVFVWTKHLQS